MTDQETMQKIKDNGFDLVYGVDKTKPEGIVKNGIYVSEMWTDDDIQSFIWLMTGNLTTISESEWLSFK